jgi:hypothetical protein
MLLIIYIFVLVLFDIFSVNCCVSFYCLLLVRALILYVRGYDFFLFVPKASSVDVLWYKELLPLRPSHLSSVDV